MKDNEVRGRLYALGSDVQSLKIHTQDLKTTMGELEECLLKGISVRDCPVCKHETLQRAGSKSAMLLPPLGAGHYACLQSGDGFDYLCLNCGKKLVCETKTECKVLKGEK